MPENFVWLESNHTSLREIFTIKTFVELVETVKKREFEG